MLEIDQSYRCQTKNRRSLASTTNFLPKYHFFEPNLKQFVNLKQRTKALHTSPTMYEQHPPQFEVTKTFCEQALVVNNKHEALHTQKADAFVPVLAVTL